MFYERLASHFTFLPLRRCEYLGRFIVFRQIATKPLGKPCCSLPCWICLFSRSFQRINYPSCPVRLVALSHRLRSVEIVVAELPGWLLKNGLRETWGVVSGAWMQYDDLVEAEGSAVRLDKSTRDCEMARNMT